MSLVSLLTCCLRLKNPCRRRTHLPFQRRNGATLPTTPLPSLPQIDKRATARTRLSERPVDTPSPSSSGHCE
jgi:hypothetical protein